MGWRKAASTPEVLKGNEQFKITEEVKVEIAKATGQDIAAFTSEDAEFDAHLDALAKQVPAVPDDIPAAAVEVKPTKEYYDHLAGHMEGEYMPASTMAELQEQVHMAKSYGADSIDGTPDLIKQVFRNDFETISKSTGYGIYHDVKVFIPGRLEDSKRQDSLTMEQKLSPPK